MSWGDAAFLALSAALFVAALVFSVLVRNRPVVVVKRRIEPAPPSRYSLPYRHPSRMTALLCDGHGIFEEHVSYYDKPPRYLSLPGPGRGTVKFEFDRVLQDAPGEFERSVAVYLLVPGQEPELVREVMSHGAEVVETRWGSGPTVWAKDISKSVDGESPGES